MLRAIQGAVPEKLQDNFLEGTLGCAGRSSSLLLLLKCAAFPSSDLPASSESSHRDRQSHWPAEDAAPPHPLLCSSLAELTQMFSPIFYDWIFLKKELKKEKNPSYMLEFPAG